MNTGKQVNAMVVVLLLTVISVGAYALFDEFRAGKAEDDQLLASAERAAISFALNCRLCHGDRGQGGVAGGRLAAAPALDRPTLQGFKEGVFSPAEFDEQFLLVTNTIMCGRAGTFMPTWGRSQGGTLSDEQIRQLAVLITGGDLGADPLQQGGFWELARDHADELDAATTDHATINMPGGFDASDTELTVNNAAPLSLGQYLRIEDERLRILPLQLEIERGVDGTEAAGHEGGVAFRRDGAEFGEVLAAEADDDAEVIEVNDLESFALGDTLQLDDELVRVTGLARGIPTTGQALVEDIGREPDQLVVSGTENIEVGTIIRIDGEQMEVTATRDDGDFDIELDADIMAFASVISVSDPAFFSGGYTVFADNELIEVVGPVETGQSLSAAIGRAETTIEVSGTAGIERGMVIRLDRELLTVTEVVSPARIDIERGAPDREGNATQGAPHTSGAAVIRPAGAPEEGEEQGPDTPTGQTLLEGIGASGASMLVTGTPGIGVGETYLIGDELVRVTSVEPAVLRVERGSGGTSSAFHSRRASIFEGNLLEVERGAGGTTFASHDAGTELFMSVLEVDRAALGSTVQDHVKNAEVFLGNTITVERGVLGTEPAEHADGTLTLDFPPRPDAPSVTGQTCGQLPPLVSDTPTGPGPTPVEGAESIDVQLEEFSVIPDPGSVVAGPVDFQVANEGSIIHNFRVALTDLAPDALPVDGFAVDESQLEIVGGFTDALQAGSDRSAPAQLAPGSYVLFCNVPTHYGLGMFAGFEVTGP